MKKLYTILYLLLSLNGFAEQYRSPLDIPLLLSASCGELRNNHFHSGIDIKTQGVVGKNIYSIADGYVSRIALSPTGYGLALYINHPATGHTSVYAHLLSYSPKFQTYIKEEQYKQESFKVDLYPDPSMFPVKKGEIVAISGNTGGSGGPHLHFEIRDTKTERVLDPLIYYKDLIEDDRPPEVRGIAAYPVAGRGVVNGSVNPLRQPISLQKNGLYSTPKQPIEAWGIIGLGIKAYDRMSKVTNTYGVKTVKLFVDDKQVFQYSTDYFTFDQTRMINTFTDFADWRLHKSFFIQSFIEPNNTLPFYSNTENRGYLTINEERPYQIRYELNDLYGNQTVYKFTIVGKKQKISPPSGCSLVMICDDDNHYISDAFSLSIPKGNLYNDVCFTLFQNESDEYFSDIYTVNHLPIPLDKSGEVKIKMNMDPLTNKQQYGLVQLKGNKPSWIGGIYENGYIKSAIRELGMTLAVWYDSEAPRIEPVTNSKKTANGLIQFRVTDNLSGVKSFRGTIDGKYALFEHDIKSTIYTYRIDDTRIEKNKRHELVFTATDACGNASSYNTEFLN